MPTATVQIAQQLEGETIGPREVHCAVRVNLQGWGSVELYVYDLSIFSADSSEWRTLAQVLGHPDVRAVTFRGPWKGEPT